MPATLRAVNCFSVGPAQSPMYRLKPAALYCAASEGSCSHTAIGKKPGSDGGPCFHCANGDCSAPKLSDESKMAAMIEDAIFIGESPRNCHSGMGASPVFPAEKSRAGRPCHWGI